MSYLGDYVEDFATLNFKFTTRTTAGVPFLLAGTPVISVYKANDTTQSTAGITLSADFDSVTGLNNVLIDLSADAFYATAVDYHVVITTGTVNSVSVVGEVVGQFSIENRFMRGTDSAALASVVGALNDAAAAGDPTTNDTVMQYVKQLINVLMGTTGIVTMPAAAAPANNISIAEMIRAIYDDSNELQGDWVNEGRLDTILDAVATPAQVNTEVLDVMNTDTIAELAQAAPSTTPTHRQAIMLLYMALLDKLDITSTFLEIHNNAGTVIAKKALTDDGTTYSEANMETGP